MMPALKLKGGIGPITMTGNGTMQKLQLTGMPILLPSMVSRSGLSGKSNPFAF